MRDLRFLVLLLALGAATGCARLEGAMAAFGGEQVADLRALDGRYAGVATYAQGPDHCARQLRMSLRVANGRLEGEVADPRHAAAPAGRFDGYLETDGGMDTLLRALGDVFVLRGRFRETRFDGQLMTEAAIDPTRNNPRQGESNIRFGVGARDCVWMVRLPRQAG
jgi:hypothetical protein